MANDVDEVKRLSSNHIGADYATLPILSGNQLRESTHKWLSPPDPSTNHNIACGTHHKKTATWFLKATSIKSGSQRARFFGSTENVCSVLSTILPGPSDTIFSFLWLWQNQY